MSGVGIGLRAAHVRELLQREAAVPWLELLADNHLRAGGRSRWLLDAVCERYPVTLHSVGMNLGGTDPIAWDYIRALRDLRDRCGAAWISDHLCFTQSREHHYHDLLPLPHTEEAIRHVAERVDPIQDFLGAPLVVENVSAYLHASGAEFDEGEFLKELVTSTGCSVLLDVNNLYVNQINLGRDPLRMIEKLPENAIREVHLGGFDDTGTFLVDAHNNRVSPPVWTLFREVMARVPDAPALVEWDNDIPELDILLDEAARARRYQKTCGIAQA